MSQLLIVLFFLTVAAAVVMLVGHGMWVLMAAIFGFLFGSDDPSGKRVCAHCGRSTSPETPRCDWCGVLHDDPTRAATQDHNTFLRHLKRLRGAGIIDEKTLGELTSRALAYRRQTQQTKQEKAVEVVAAEIIEESRPKPEPAKPTSPPPKSPFGGDLRPADLPVAKHTPVKSTPPDDAKKPSHVPKPRPVASRPPREKTPPAAKPVAKPAPVATAVQAPTPAPAPAPAPVPAPPRRSFGQMLEAFMEERNMRWGELVGGMLFVGGAVALAVSLRNKLAEVPYSQFLIFASIAAAVIGLGLYAHHRWRLATTSRGMLMIGSLLVPLGFLIMAGLTKVHGQVLTICVEGVSLAVFGFLLWPTMKVLVPNGRALGTAGVLGQSAVMLGMARLAGSELPIWLTVCVALVPSAIFASVVMAYMRQFSTKSGKTGTGGRLETADAVAGFSLLGTAAFALVLAHGLLVVQGGKVLDMAVMLECLAPALALSSLPMLAMGLTISRSLVGDTDKDSGKVAGKSEAVEAYRMAGTAVGLVGLADLLAAVGLAWPSPVSLIAVGLLAAGVLVWTAFRYRMPAMHAGAIASISLVALVGYQTAVGDLLSLGRAELPREMLRMVTSASSANVLAAVFVAMAIVAELLVRRGQRRHGAVYLGGCAVLAVIGLSLVTWHGFAGGPDALRGAILFGLYASVCLGLAGRWRNALFADAGVWLAAGSMLWAARWADLPFAGAFLLHASLAALALLAIRIWGGGKDDRTAGITLSLERRGNTGEWESVSMTLRAWLSGNRHLLGSPSNILDVFSKALLLGALCSSILAWPSLLLQPPETKLAAAGFVFWISVIWMLIGVLVGKAKIVAAAQATLSLAAVLASTSWIESRGLLLDNPTSLQAYLLPLAALGLAWAGIRIALGKIPSADRLLNPNWIPVDVALQYAVVCCQFVAVAWWLIVACGGEFFGAARIASLAKVPYGCGLGAWLVLIVLAAWAVVSLWNRWRDSELIVAIVIALTVPCLIASAFVGSLASASAARWAMAGCFVACSLPVWYRRDVRRLLLRAGAKLELGHDAPRIARGMIVTVAGGAVVGLTVFAALFELTGSRSVGPMAGSFFESMGSQISYLVPLLGVIAVLVGYAVRERSSGYAFMAGLVVEIAVVLGYALSVTLAGRPDYPHFPITLLQLATTTAAVWAGLWLGARRWIAIWNEDTNTPPAKVLLNVQLAMAIVGNLLLLCPAFAMLALSSSWFDKWIGAVGLPAGWAALLLTVAVVVWHGIQRGRTVGLANFIGIAGLAAVGLLACSVQQYCIAFDLDDNWSYRTLMIGWAMYSLTVVLSTWWASVLLSEDEAQGPPLVLVRAASVWVAISGMLAVGLGLKAAFVHGDQLWAAMAIALPSMAGAVMAVWQRREWWAFTSALGVNVAASLVVWHVELSTPFEDWWVMLVQANVIASAVVALVWMAARSQLKRLRDLAEGAGPLLTTQILMAAAGNCLLLALPVAYLIHQPQAVPQWMMQLCGPAGWTALLLSVGATAWLEGRLGTRQMLHVFCAFATGAVILAACGLSSHGAWTAFHVLVGGWTAIVLLITGLGVFGQELRLGGWRIFSAEAVSGWAFVGSIAVLAFTLMWCLADPWSPRWPGGMVLALSLAAGVIGAWRRLPAVVYTSGILVNVAGTIAWAAWMPRRLETFLEVNALCLAATAVVWSLVDTLMKRRPSVMRTGGVQWPYAQVAIRLALGMLGTLAAVLVYQDFLGLDHPLPELFTWISIASVAAALVVMVWDRSSWITLSGMYTLGLVTIALGLVRAELEQIDMIWLGTIELGGFALVAALVGWALPGLWPLWQRLGIRRESRGKMLSEWFPAWQLIAAGLTAVASAWIAIDIRFEQAGHEGLSWMGGRLFAAAAVAALICAGVLMAQQTKQHWREVWQYFVMTSAALLLACLGWALLPVDQEARLLHLAAVLMIACTGTCLAAAGGLRLVLPKASEWIDAGRRMAAPLAAVALASLVVVLGLEFMLYEEPHGPPTELWAELSVATALLALCGGCICLAVVPGLEPFGLSQRGRTLYVYAAEALLLLLCLHLRLTMPELFDLGFIRRYWMLIVMAVAFAGAGLSEWFQRLRQPVLSEPLANTALVAPLLPAVGFWFMPAASAAMWFLMCAFYGMMATIKRSFTLGGLSILAGNMGLWVLWHKMGLEFFQHPQIWLIPGALAVLAAGYLHRDRLSEAQNVGLRWAALGVIYVSSAADMFLAGIGNSVWLPLVLAALSVAGVLAGILFRVRSFLYLGTTFLGLVIVTMIKYAAWDRQQMWILWSCCILLGAGVIGLFAVFEKRRNDVLAAVDRFKEWKA